MGNAVLNKNEKESNKLAAQIMLITISFVGLVYLLNTLRIFVAPQEPMTIAMSVSTLLLLVPSLLVFILKQYGAWVKYAIVTCCIFMVTVISLFLTWHVVLMYIFPITVASLFFSRRLSWYAIILSQILFAGSQVGGFILGSVNDFNLTSLYSVIVHGMAPRAIELFAISLIFVRLSSRTNKLLTNSIGAEEQKDTLDRMMAITDKSYEVTNILADSVKELSVATGHAITSNEQIAKMAGNIVDGSQQTIHYVEQAGSVVSSVATNLNVIANENILISEVSHETKRLTDSNAINMKDAAEGVRQIDEATNRSRDVILRLSETSSQIVKITQVIKSIAQSTNLLSLNASIESARAGEHGRGFAVVAAEIRTLAGQSQNAAKSIEELMQQVVGETTEAVKSMDYNTKLVENGLTLINKADTSSEEVTKSIAKVNTMAEKIAGLSSTIAENGNQINDAVGGISDLTVETLDRLKEILKSSEEQLKAMNGIAAYVKSIDTSSDELLSVINQNK